MSLNLSDYLQTWHRGRPSSVSSTDGLNASPAPERRRLELLPRSKPHTISESSLASSVPSEDQSAIVEEVTPTEEKETPTLVPRSELIVATTTTTNTVVLMSGPPPGLEDVVPTPPEGNQTNGGNKKKKNKKKWMNEWSFCPSLSLSLLFFR